MKMIQFRFFASIGVGLIAANAAFFGDPGNIEAAVIDWGSVFTIDSPADISNPPGSSNYAAIDLNTPTGFAMPGGDNIINGIRFSRADLTFPNVGLNIDSGPIYDPTNFEGSTGDQDLDDLLDSYSYLARDPGGSGFGFATAVGARYQIQIIGIADSHPCCSGYTYELDDGMGRSTTGITLRRGLAQSVIGTFTADAPTQGVTLRSLNFVAGNPNPGFAGLVIRLLNNVPEPSSIALVGIASAGLLTARRWRAR